MTSVLLAFHYRDEPDIPRLEPESPRALAWDFVRPRVREQYGWHSVEVFDSGHTPYSRAASRNAAAKYALENNYDVVVIHDADSWADDDSLKAAIEGAYVGTPASIHIPFTEVNVYHPKWLKRQRHFGAWPVMYRYGPSFGGIYVCRPEVWFEAKGQDERVTGWGFEDEIFLVNAWTYLPTGPVYHSGGLHTFYHERGPLADYKEANFRIRDAFNAAIHNRERLDELNDRAYDFGSDSRAAVAG